jgi:hypothetical protein
MFLDTSSVDTNFFYILTHVKKWANFFLLDYNILHIQEMPNSLNRR